MSDEANLTLPPPASAIQNSVDSLRIITPIMSAIAQPPRPASDKPSKKRKRSSKAAASTSTEAEAPVASPEPSSSKQTLDDAPLPATNAMPIAATKAAYERVPFSTLELSPQTSAAIQRMGFETMTEVQARTIPPLLAGKDVLGAARTGSGKTMSFLVPSVEMLSTLRFKPVNGGLYSQHVTPRAHNRHRSHCHLADARTRAADLRCRQGAHAGPFADVWCAHGRSEPKGGGRQAGKGCQLDRGHPGSSAGSSPGETGGFPRDPSSSQNTKGFVFKNLKALVIDEADRILEIGFEEEMKQIIKILPNGMSGRRESTWSVLTMQRTDRQCSSPLPKPQKSPT